MMALERLIETLEAGGGLSETARLPERIEEPRETDSLPERMTGPEGAPRMPELPDAAEDAGAGPGQPEIQDEAGKRADDLSGAPEGAEVPERQSDGVDDGSLDDNGKPYKTDAGELIPNNTYIIDGTVYKTDDRGELYSIDGRLCPNHAYRLNGNVYKTDENGRITEVQAVPVLSPETPRDNDAQRDAGGKDRQEGDQGGHIVGRDMGGDGGEGNLVAMDSKINQSDYKRMENDIKRALGEGKEVSACTELSYQDGSDRPDEIQVTVTVDGKETVYTFDNNMDGSLEDRVAETGGKDAAETVQSVLEETGGEVSSIKEEYDENGSLGKVTVSVTYTDENGKAQRTKVIIDNPKGGNT